MTSNIDYQENIKKSCVLYLVYYRGKRYHQNVLYLLYFIATIKYCICYILQQFIKYVGQMAVTFNFK